MGKVRRLVRLNPSQGAALLKAIVEYKRAKAKLETASAELKKVGAKYKHLLPDDTEAHVKGQRIRRWMGGGGETFSLSAYKDAGHAVTQEMRAHINPRERYDVWDVEPIEGPPES